MTAKPIPVPQGHYVSACRQGVLIFTAGMTPRKAGVLLHKGRIGASDEVQQHEAAVVLATGNALTAACALLCDDEEIEAILHLTVYLAVEEGFTEHSRIADFASSYLASVLGSAGLGARAAVGVAALPGGAPVEVQLVASAKDKSAGDNAFSANKEAQDA